MAINEINTLTVSQCISPDYCRGWNDAIKEANKTIEKLENMLDDKCDKCIEREMHNGMEIVFDRLDKCLSFGTTDGVYVSMNDIDKIKKDLTGEE
jgi:hypothetical protein